MKKALPIIFALVVVLALLVGCGPPAVKEPVGSESGGKEPVGSESGGKDPSGSLNAAEITVQVEEGWVEYYEAAAKRVGRISRWTINFKQVASFTHLDTLGSTDALTGRSRSLRTPADRLTDLANKICSEPSMPKRSPISSAVGTISMPDSAVCSKWAMSISHSLTTLRHS